MCYAVCIFNKIECRAVFCGLVFVTRCGLSCGFVSLIWVFLFFVMCAFNVCAILRAFVRYFDLRVIVVLCHVRVDPVCVVLGVFVLVCVMCLIFVV